MLFVKSDSLLYFLEIGILDVIVLAGLLRTSLLSALETCVGTGLTTCLLVHLGASGLECLVQFFDGSIDGRNVLCLVCFLQFAEGSFDGGLVLSGELVAEFFQLLLCLENHAVSLVNLVHTFAFFLVGFCVGFGHCLHAIDFFLAEA